MGAAFSRAQNAHGSPADSSQTLARESQVKGGAAGSRSERTLETTEHASIIASAASAVTSSRFVAAQRLDSQEQ